MILIRWLSVVARRTPGKSLVASNPTVEPPIESTRREENRRSTPSLTRWDVALVVFKILGVLGALVGLVFALISS